MENTDMEIREEIVARPNHDCTLPYHQCFFCRQDFPTSCLKIVYVRNGCELGQLCDECAQASPGGVAGRVLEISNIYASAAADMEQDAEAIRNMPPDIFLRPKEIREAHDRALDHWGAYWFDN
jgi:hypothetical protein